AEAKRRKEAREALDAQTSLIMEDLLSRQPVLTEEHQQFLRQALQAYEQFAADTGQEEESRSGVAEAYLRVGGIHGRLGVSAEAGKAYRQAIALYEQLVADFPAVPIYRRRLAMSHHYLSVALAQQGEWSSAREAKERAIALQEQVIRDFPEVPEH